MVQVLSISILALLVFLILYAYSVARTYFRRPALIHQNGCQLAKRYPHSDPLLGLDLVFETIKSAHNRCLLSSLTQRHNTWGRTFQTVSFGKTILNTIEPKILKTVFATESVNFGVEPIRAPPAHALVGKGIFTTDGADWAHSRALTRPSFTRAQFANLTSLERHVDRLLELIPRKGATVDLQPLFCRFSLDSSSEYLFGKSTDSLSPNSSADAVTFIEAFAVAQYGVGQRVRLGKLRFLYQSSKWRQACKTVHDFIDNHVGMAINSQASADNKEAIPADRPHEQYILLNEMAKATKDPIELRYQVLNVFLGGHESTAIALSNIFFDLARNEAAYQKLRAEILGIGTTPITLELLRSLKYLRHVISESLRLHPIAPLLSRVCLHDTIVPAGGGPDSVAALLIRRRETVAVSTYALHRCKSLWGEDADTFWPERWETVRPTWEYMAFGGGTRICPAQQLALTEVSYVIVRLVKEFKTVEERDGRPWTEMLKMTVCNRNGVQVAINNIKRN